MRPPYPVLLVTHPGFGEGLLLAAKAILGDFAGLDHLSNQGLSPEDLRRRIDEWAAAHPGSVLILTDVGFGSCCQSARRVARDRPGVGVMAGVNLPMLLAVLRSRPQPDLRSWMRHLEDRAREGVEVHPEASCEDPPGPPAEGLPGAPPEAPPR